MVKALLLIENKRIAALVPNKKNMKWEWKGLKNGIPAQFLSGAFRSKIDQIDNFEDHCLRN